MVSEILEKESVLSVTVLSHVVSQPRITVLKAMYHSSTTPKNTASRDKIKKQNLTRSLICPCF